MYQLISRNSFQLQWNYFSFRKIHNYQMWNNVNILFILEYFVNTSLVPNSITILIAHNFCKKVQIFHNSYTCTLTLLLPLLKAQYCLSKKIGDDWEKKRCFKNLLPLFFPATFFPNSHNFPSFPIIYQATTSSPKNNFAPLTYRVPTSPMVFGNFGISWMVPMRFMMVSLVHISKISLMSYSSGI